MRVEVLSPMPMPLPLRKHHMMRSAAAVFTSAGTHVSLRTVPCHLCREQGGSGLAPWLSGGLLRHQILLWATPSIGQAQEISRLSRAGWPHRPWVPRAPLVDPHPITCAELELAKTAVDDVLLGGLGGRAVDGSVDDRVGRLAARVRCAHGGRAAVVAAVVQPGQGRRSMDSAARCRHSDREHRREPGWHLRH